MLFDSAAQRDMVEAALRANSISADPFAPLPEALPAGCCREWVTSATIGQFASLISSMFLGSTTRSL